MSDDVVRPTALHWLRYVYVGRVPARNSAWVLHDATSRTWVLRHTLRYLVLIAPLVAGVLVFLPAPFGLRVLSCVAAALPMAMFYLAYTCDALEQRVENAGYPNGIAAQLREERSVRDQQANAARYRERRAVRTGSR